MDDDVRLADLGSPCMRVLVPALGRQVARADDLLDGEEPDQPVDEAAAADVSQPGVEDEQVACAQLLADLPAALPPVAVREVAEVGIGVRRPVAERGGEPAKA